jgi:hypothetical protein
MFSPLLVSVVFGLAGAVPVAYVLRRQPGLARLRRALARRP